MAEPTITCPKCSTEIKLTESLAAPLIADTRRKYEHALTQKDAEIAKRETEIRSQQTALEKEKAAIGEQVAERVAAERTRIAAEETKKAKLLAAADLDQKSKQLADLQDVLRERDAKLAEAQKAQAELIRKLGRKQLT